ncbi:YlbF family regulator [Staphylococcus lutrae]|uniref:YlbF family regulator n=1 Tax=Staphylococcus lutrae TaxID=155085 RepID=A0AAC9RWH4_9STAP|nr:YlbF family regulator [Staphylococcus lutrae]ARJ52030.1 hypothetical protein B5P37_09665 [Staphylococcus lutrae]PNZ39261.1 YlbF family regulator [Staphylococcus lutrae]
MYDEQFMCVLDQTEALAVCIRQSALFDHYQKAKQSLVEDEEAQRLYGQFLKSKIRFDEVQRFGRYHPDYQKVMLTTRQCKRAYEMHHTVQAFKKSETALQQLLDEVVTIIANGVSEHIKIDAGAPLFEALTTGGGCAVGATCQCH